MGPHSRRFQMTKDFSTMKVLLLSGLCLSIVGALPQGIVPRAISPEDISPQNPDLLEPQYQERQPGNLTDIESIENFMGIKPDENGMYTIGDVMVTAEELLWLFGTEGTDRNATPNPMALWPVTGNVPNVKGVMRFDFDSSVPRDLKLKIMPLIWRFNKEMKGCLAIKFKATHPDYVTIQTTDPGCWSLLGRAGGEQRLNLAKGCERSGTIIHELIHAWGFFHEHQRPDRDNFVKILWENIDPK